LVLRKHANPFFLLIVQGKIDIYRKLAVSLTL